MKDHANVRVDGALKARPHLGGLVFERKSYHSVPLVYDDAGAQTYGEMLDNALVDAVRQSPDQIITSFKIELSDDAAFALRDQIVLGRT